MAALLCCKKRYRKHEECETVETVEAVGTVGAVHEAAVPVQGAYGQVQEEVHASEGSYDHSGPRPPYRNGGGYSVNSC